MCIVQYGVCSVCVVCSMCVLYIVVCAYCVLYWGYDCLDSGVDDDLWIMNSVCCAPPLTCKLVVCIQHVFSTVDIICLLSEMCKNKLATVVPMYL